MQQLCTPPLSTMWLFPLKAFLYSVKRLNFPCAFCAIEGDKTFSLVRHWKYDLSAFHKLVYDHFPPASQMVSACFFCLSHALSPALLAHTLCSLSALFTFFLLPLHSNSLCHWNVQIHPFVLNLLALCNLDVLRPSLINSMRSSRPSVPLCPLPVTGGMGGGSLKRQLLLPHQSMKSVMLTDTNCMSGKLCK